jgi:hypothetical protein
LRNVLGQSYNRRVMKPSLVVALVYMEARLETLIEGNLLRLFPQATNRQTVTHQLIEALKRDINSEGDDMHRAPNGMILLICPADAGYINQNPGVLEELADQIEMAAREAKISFYNAPVIRVQSDPTVPPGEIRFEFEQDFIRPGTTAVLPATPGSRSQAIPANAYLIIEGSQVYNLDQAVTNLGRRSDNQIVFTDQRVSRQHAQIRATGGKFVIFDLQSRGGTFVNGMRIHQKTLIPGDVISLAGILLVFGQESAPDFSKTEEFRPPSID